MLLASLGIQITSLSMLWRVIDWRLSLPYLAGGLIALAPGMYVVTQFNPTSYICGLGVLLLLYGAIMFARPSALLTSDGPAARVLIGVTGGITGPLAAFPAAFVGIWCGIRGFDKQSARSIIQPYILVMQVATLAAFAIAGNSPIKVAYGALIYVVPGVIGACVGTKMFNRLTDQRYQRLVVLGLLLSGLMLIVK
jgi:uncharacterized membrane protein YfcA